MFFSSNLDAQAISSDNPLSHPATHRALVVVLLVSLAACFSAGAQEHTLPSPPPDALGSPMSDGPRVNPVLQEQMAHRRNEERQKQLVADTDKLLQLAQQLHEEVAKSNKDELSVSVVKTSSEIEKLAKSVREKMRGY